MEKRPGGKGRIPPLPWARQVYFQNGRQETWRGPATFKSGTEHSESVASHCLRGGESTGCGAAENPENSGTHPDGETGRQQVCGATPKQQASLEAAGRGSRRAHYLNPAASAAAAGRHYPRTVPVHGAAGLSLVRRYENGRGRDVAQTARKPGSPGVGRMGEGAHPSVQVICSNVMQQAVSNTPSRYAFYF